MDNFKEQYQLISKAKKALLEQEQQLTLAYFKHIYGFDFEPNKYFVNWLSLIDNRPIADISIDAIYGEQDHETPLTIMAHYAKGKPQYIVHRDDYRAEICSVSKK